MGLLVQSSGFPVTLSVQYIWALLMLGASYGNFLGNMEHILRQGNSITDRGGDIGNDSGYSSVDTEVRQGEISRPSSYLLTTGIGVALRALVGLGC